LQTREIHLERYPEVLPTPDDFRLVTVDLPDPLDGEVLVRNRFMPVDPYIRGRMRESNPYFTPFAVSAALDGGCIGEVISSNCADLVAGGFVSGFFGWREHSIAPGETLSRVDPDLAPLSTYLGTLGMPGLTAYVGLLDVARAESGQTVFVSAASGAVGSIVSQIARIVGCHVVGSAGSDEKVAWLRDEARLNAAFNYKSVDDLSAELSRHCPDGIDVYFDNVGGNHLEAALNRMNFHGRIALCGMISQYNDTESPPGPANLMLAVGKRLKLQGFIVSDYNHRQEAFRADMAAWIGAGEIKWRETVVQGLESAPEAFIGLFRADNFGKIIVELGD
jgi:NADPH-dependent curcumin reductase CurA